MRGLKVRQGRSAHNLAGSDAVADAVGSAKVPQILDHATADQKGLEGVSLASNEVATTSPS